MLSPELEVAVYISHILFAAAVRKTNNEKFKNETDNDIESHARKWLVNSRDRCGGRTLRNKVKAVKSRSAGSTGSTSHRSEASAPPSPTPTTMRRGKQITVPPEDTSDDLFHDISGNQSFDILHGERRSPSPSMIGTYA